MPRLFMPSLDFLAPLTQWPWSKWERRPLLNQSAEKVKWLTYLFRKNPLVCEYLGVQCFHSLEFPCELAGQMLCIKLIFLLYLIQYAEFGFSQVYYLISIYLRLVQLSFYYWLLIYILVREHTLCDFNSFKHIKICFMG